MSSIKTRTLSAALLLSAAAFPAASLAEGLYLGATVGIGMDGDYCDVSGFTGDCDDQRNVGKLYVGWGLGKYLAVEGGYTDLGEATVTGTIGATGISATADVSAWQAGVVGMLPLGDKWNAFARVGALAWDNSQSCTSTAAGCPLTGDKGTDVTGAIGFDLKGDGLTMRMEVERYRYEVSGTTMDVNAFMLGVVYNWE
jgi:hypothetical protein